MKGVRLRSCVAASLLGCALLAAPLALPGAAQEPSDPSGCTSAYADQDFCSDTGDDPTEVLSNTFTKAPAAGGSGGSSLLPKTGGDYALLVLAGVLITAAGIRLRKVAQRT